MPTITLLRQPEGKLGCRLSGDNTVSEVHKGGAAEAAGLKTGWLVESINGKTTSAREGAAVAVLQGLVKQSVFRFVFEVVDPPPRAKSAGAKRKSPAEPNVKQETKAPAVKSQKSPAAKPEKKPDHAAVWKSLVEPALKKSNDGDAQALAQSLFQLVWTHAGEEAARAAVAPLCKRVQKQERAREAAAKAAAAKPQFDGTWVLRDGDDIAGELDIDHQGLKLSNADDNCPLEWKDPKADDDYDCKLKGEIYQWGNCRDDFKVTLLVSHDPDSDTIEGEVSVSPRRNVDYGPPDAFGAGFTFTGERQAGA
jgi:hypothetical protein